MSDNTMILFPSNVDPEIDFKSGDFTGAWRNLKDGQIISPDKLHLYVHHYDNSGELIRNVISKGLFWCRDLSVYYKCSERVAKERYLARVETQKFLTDLLKDGGNFDSIGLSLDNFKQMIVDDSTEPYYCTDSLEEFTKYHMTQELEKELAELGQDGQKQGI